MPKGYEDYAPRTPPLRDALAELYDDAVVLGADDEDGLEWIRRERKPQR